MKPAAKTNSQDGARPESGRPAKRRWPLIGAIGLTVIGAMGLAYALATVTGYRNAAPVPLSPQAFSFPDQPVAVDRGGIPAVEKFYEELGLKSVGIYVDQNGTALNQLGLLGIPATLLVNPEGREVGRKLGPAEWDSAEVEAVLREHLALPSAEPAAGAAP
jgi:hypothetical protein